MAKRKRSDSLAAKKAAFNNIAKTEKPSFISLTDKENEYFEAIIATKGKWTQNDLIIATQLAKIECEIDDYWELVKDKRRLISKDKNVRVSPAHRVLEDLIATQMSLCRSLQVHARATQGESRDQVKQNELHSEVRETIDKKSNLIARPTLQ